MADVQSFLFKNAFQSEEASREHLDSVSIDSQTWQELKQVIATSSGFQRWQLERDENRSNSSSLDYLVRRYLRETLETLAY